MRQSAGLGIGSAPFWGAAACVCTAVLVTSCGSSPPRASAPVQGRAGAQIVIDFNSGRTGDTYTAVAPIGGTTRPLGVPGYLRAGFDDTLTKAAIVGGGELNGSAADQSNLSVSKLGTSQSKVIWRFVGSVNYPLAWNPAGSEVAVGLAASTDRGGRTYSKPSPGLWVISSDGASHRELVQGEVGQVAWSRDGKRIAFLSTAVGTPATLRVVPVGGGGQETIAMFKSQLAVSYGNPTLSWSPDGKAIAVAYTTHMPVRQTTSSVAVYPVGGGAPHVVLGPSSSVVYTGAAFSPDGAKLAVTTFAPPPSSSGGDTSQTTAVADPSVTVPGSSLDLVDLTGGAPQIITRLPEIPIMIGWYPAR